MIMSIVGTIAVLVLLVDLMANFADANGMSWLYVICALVAIVAIWV